MARRQMATPFHNPHQHKNSLKPIPSIFRLPYQYKALPQRANGKRSAQLGCGSAMHRLATPKVSGCPLLNN